MGDIVGVGLSIELVPGYLDLYTVTASVTVQFLRHDVGVLDGTIEVWGRDEGQRPRDDGPLFQMAWTDPDPLLDVPRQTFHFSGVDGSQHRVFQMTVRGVLLDEDPGADIVDAAAPYAPQPAFHLVHFPDEVFARVRFSANGRPQRPKDSAVVTKQFGPHWRIAGSDEGPAYPLPVRRHS